MIPLVSIPHFFSLFYLLLYLVSAINRASWGAEMHSNLIKNLQSFGPTEGLCQQKHAWKDIWCLHFIEQHRQCQGKRCNRSQHIWSVGSNLIESQKCVWVETRQLHTLHVFTVRNHMASAPQRIPARHCDTSGSVTSVRPDQTRAVSAAWSASDL